MVDVAIIGTGAISDSHIQGYLKLPDRCRIVALVNRHPEKALKMGKKFGLNAAVYKDCVELLSKQNFDAASVCLPPFEHAGVTLDLLRAGKHVLVEKPMAVSLEECDQMVGSAQVSGKVLAVVAQNRFTTGMVKLKRVLESGLLGKVLHAQVDSFWWRGSNYYDLWWRGTWLSEGGGCTVNHGVHHIDLLIWLMGMPSEVQSVSLNLAHENSEVEDFSTSILTYPNGSVSQITASLAHHGEEQRMVFQCEKAKVAVPWHVRAARQKENGFPEENAELAKELQVYYDQLPALEREGHEAQIANFIVAIEGREEPWVDGEEGRKAIELVTAIYQAGHLEQKVSLPFGANEPFYTRMGILERVRHFHEKTRSIENFASNEITIGPHRK
jgi:UDP-N-acetyl-2-amino-2-deoxyglucuronate dehydrogenase